MRWKSQDDWSWHRWFAWYPVLTNEGFWVWLEWIERRHEGLYDIDAPWWYYRVAAAPATKEGE